MMTPDAAARSIDTMNKILANACPSQILREGNKSRRNVGQVGKYWIEAHCVGFWVTAKLVSVLSVDNDNFRFQYEILAIDMEDN